MEYSKLINPKGFTLIELVMVIIIMGIVSSIAIQKIAPVADSFKFEETRNEMNRLAEAIVGNPELQNNGVRSSFGYVGDVGALPPNLDALYTNPGYATWSGPYIENAFAQKPDDFKKDAWQSDYIYSGITISSIGSGETIERRLAGSADHLLRNRISGNVYDLDGTPPGTLYHDSVGVRLTVPDGTGGLISRITDVSPGGFFSLDSIPIGNHQLEIVCQPGNDTLRRFVSVPPNSRPYGEYYLPRDIWPAGGTGGAGGIEFIPESDTLSTANCFKLSIWIANSSDSSIAVSSLTLTWSAPAGYYKTVTWNGIIVRGGNPALGSGDPAVFTSVQVIDPGQSVKIDMEAFHADPDGGGQPVDMTGTALSIDFSDGSTINLTADFCQ